MKERKTKKVQLDFESFGAATPPFPEKGFRRAHEEEGCCCTRNVRRRPFSFSPALFLKTHKPKKGDNA